MSTEGVVPNHLVARHLVPEWKAGSTTSPKKIVRTIFRLLKVSRLSFLTFYLFSSVLCSVFVITVVDIS